MRKQKRNFKTKKRVAYGASNGAYLFPSMLEPSGKTLKKIFLLKNEHDFNKIIFKLISLSIIETIKSEITIGLLNKMDVFMEEIENDIKKIAGASFQFEKKLAFARRKIIQREFSRYTQEVLSVREIMSNNLSQSIKNLDIILDTKKPKYFYGKSKKQVRDNIKSVFYYKIIEAKQIFGLKYSDSSKDKFNKFLTEHIFVHANIFEVIIGSKGRPLTKKPTDDYLDSFMRNLERYLKRRKLLKRPVPTIGLPKNVPLS